MNNQINSYVLSLIRTKYPTRNQKLKQLVRQYKLEKENEKQ